MKTRARLFEQPPKSGEQTGSDAQRGDRVVFPSGRDGVSRGESVDAGQKRVDGAKFVILFGVYVWQMGTRDEQHAESGNSRGGGFVALGQELLEQALALGGFLPNRELDVGVGAALIILTCLGHRRKL